jgi:16S rRNA (guanine527-N7)-methyltransferase
MDEAIIFKYFPELTEWQKVRFQKLQDLYLQWNAQINVISRKDMERFYLHHVLHSLAIARYVGFKDFTEIMDVGTGGGFPGIPLAICFPKASFHLVDSIGKKIKVVDAVVEALELTNVKTTHARVEQIDESYDFIVSRAVTNLSDFVRWTGYKFHRKSFNHVPNGIIYLKGGDVTEELSQVRGLKKIVTEIGTYFDDPYFETKKIVHLYRQ